jgi:hypothetical protein
MSSSPAIHGCQNPSLIRIRVAVDSGVACPCWVWRRRRSTSHTSLVRKDFRSSCSCFRGALDSAPPANLSSISAVTRSWRRWIGGSGTAKRAGHVAIWTCALWTGVFEVDVSRTQDRGCSSRLVSTEVRRCLSQGSRDGVG